MSALEGLWLWLQGRKSPTNTVPDGKGHAEARARDAREAGERKDAADLRTQRNCRYRAGPWQMK